MTITAFYKKDEELALFASHKTKQKGFLIYYTDLPTVCSIDLLNLFNEGQIAVEQILEYGPYTPQEADRASKWLKDKQIHFSLIKDEQAEKLAMMNDGQTVVNRLSYRSDVYLGQIFFIQLHNATPEVRSQFENKFAVKAEVLTEPQSVMSENEEKQIVSKRDSKQRRMKRLFSGVFAFAIITLIIVSIFKIF